jgi:uncharacterized ParB-like nuclease family protein
MRGDRSSEMQRIGLSKIKRDGGTQPRGAIDETVVEQYMEDIDQLPPVDLYYDGEVYWMADGFHRAEAHERAGQKTIPANVHQGTRRDAILHSVGANAKHGLRRSNADKRRAVMTLLQDEEWSKWSDRDIAKACAVSHTMVAIVRGPKSGNRCHSDKGTGKQTKSLQDTPDAEVKPETGRKKPPATAERKSSGSGRSADGSVPKEAPAAPTADEPTDSQGRPIPTRQALRDALTNAAEYSDRALELVRQLTGIVNEFSGDGSDGRKGEPKAGGELLSAKRHEARAHLKNIRTLILYTRPHAVCCYCGGKEQSPKCQACKGLGWLTEEIYNAAPKKIREVAVTA